MCVSQRVMLMNCEEHVCCKHLLYSLPRLITPCVAVDGTDGEEISVLIWVHPGPTGAALSKRCLSVAVNISV